MGSGFNNSNLLYSSIHGHFSSNLSATTCVTSSINLVSTIGPSARKPLPPPRPSRGLEPLVPNNVNQLMFPYSHNTKNARPVGSVAIPNTSSPYNLIVPTAPSHDVPLSAGTSQTANSFNSLETMAQPARSLGPDQPTQVGKNPFTCPSFDASAGVNPSSFGGPNLVSKNSDSVNLGENSNAHNSHVDSNLGYQAFGGPIQDPNFNMLNLRFNDNRSFGDPKNAIDQSSRFYNFGAPVQASGYDISDNPSVNHPHAGPNQMPANVDHLGEGISRRNRGMDRGLECTLVDLKGGGNYPKHNTTNRKVDHHSLGGPDYVQPYPNHNTSNRNIDHHYLGGPDYVQSYPNHSTSNRKIDHSLGGPDCVPNSSVVSLARNSGEYWQGVDRG